MKGNKITVLVQKLRWFCWMGVFCLKVELHRQGSAPAACAAGLFMEMLNWARLQQIQDKWLFWIFKVSNFFILHKGNNEPLNDFVGVVFLVVATTPCPCEDRLFLRRCKLLQGLNKQILTSVVHKGTWMLSQAQPATAVVHIQATLWTTDF